MHKHTNLYPNCMQQQGLKLNSDVSVHFWRESYSSKCPGKAFFFLHGCWSIKIGLRSFHNLISLWLPATDFYWLTGANVELCWEAFICQVWAEQLFSICCYWQSHSMEQCLLFEWIPLYIWTCRRGRKRSWHRFKMRRKHFRLMQKQLLHNSPAEQECGVTFAQETVEKWPDADKVDFLWHLRDLTEDHRLSPQIGIRYSWANGALNLLISLDPSPDHTGLFRFLSSQRTTQLTPSVHAYYSINDKYSSSGFMRS